VVQFRVEQLWKYGIYPSMCIAQLLEFMIFKGKRRYAQ